MHLNIPEMVFASIYHEDNNLHFYIKKDSRLFCKLGLLRYYIKSNQWTPY